MLPGPSSTIVAEGPAGPAWNRHDLSLEPMTSIVRQLIIHGTTLEGNRFRPSDWGDRLSGVMSRFRPPGSQAHHLTYSPFVYPLLIEGESCVAVDHRLRDLEPLAWKFVCDFAQSNRLRTSERTVTTGM